MSNRPRLLLCAPASGGGKTTVTCAILQALVDEGKHPVAFKSGPDYIDPMFHSEVIGAKSRNLDLFFMGADLARALLWENGAAGELSLIEGAMGYYDGVGLSDEASAWDLARTTETPAVLVVDGRGRALSAAALVKGFSDFRPHSGIKGVLLNRVSPMLYPRLKESIEAETGLSVYGYLPELPNCTLESRHLGLVTAAEVKNLKEKLHLLAEQVKKTVDLDGLADLAHTAPDLAPQSVQTMPVTDKAPKIAVARDSAFCFYYADGLSYLRHLGAELIEFSPLADGVLPAGISGLYLGGGYPELYAKALSENTSMRESVRGAIAMGLPCVAECGGFLYLHERLEGADGAAYPMAGAIASQGFRTDKLARFGYVTLTAEEDGLLAEEGDALPAHEFHYWDSTAPGAAFTARKPRSDRTWTCAHMTKTLYAGFPHFHFRACPKAAERFVKACEIYQEGHK